MNPIEIANQAAAQSDRWLFLCAIVLLVMGGAYAIRWLVSKNEKLIETHHTTLQKISGDQNETNLKLAGVLERNSTAMNNCAEAMNDCATELRYCRDTREKK